MSASKWGVLLAGALGLGFATLGCVKETRFRDDVFYNKQMGYTLPYAHAQSRSFLPDGWVLENYHVDGAGHPTTPKTGSDWQRTLSIDLDDGKPVDLTVDTYDLRFAHAETNATIWLRSIPVAPRAAKRDLQGVANDWAEGLSGTGFFALDAGPVKVGAQQFATRIIRSRVGRIVGEPAFDVTVELANVDQLRLDPNFRSAIGRVVFARTKFEYGLKRFGDRPLALPIRWMIGYANNPRDFARQEKDFEGFLRLFAPEFDVTPSTSAPPSTSGSTPTSSAPSTSAPTPASEATF